MLTVVFGLFLVEMLHKLTLQVLPRQNNVIAESLLDCLGDSTEKSSLRKDVTSYTIRIINECAPEDNFPVRVRIDSTKINFN